VKYPRCSGILLHPTSLPERFGIGDLGPSAYAFVDFLAAAGQRLWQVLPLGPTGFGDSPYQVFSAFAGNPLLISLETLAHQGLLKTEDWDEGEEFPLDKVDYGRVIGFKLPLLRLAFKRFKTKASSDSQFEDFCRHNSSWLQEFALFMAIKEAHGGMSWDEWEPAIVMRQPEALARWTQELAHEIECHKFLQFTFFEQWSALKSYCHQRAIRIMGDIPIFVSRDSADVWSHPELFHLDSKGRPTVVAGVPPDYFSATGQLWGNPLYRWDTLEESGYRWWIERFRSTFEIVDMVRLDHFRGFESYWEVPALETTAIHGRWVKANGERLFAAVQRELGRLPIVAENLGVITPEVEALRKRFGFPGMAVLQFAFGSGPESEFLPHNYRRNCLVYTGTHDNDTVAGWWTGDGTQGSTRQQDAVLKEREFAMKYLGCDGSEIHWSFIRAVMASVADLAIVPLQDVLGLGSEARMNLPARAEDNWRWRFLPGALTENIRERLKELTRLYGRLAAEDMQSVPTTDSL